MSAAGVIPIERLRLDGVRRQSLEIGRNRLLVTAVVFLLAFGGIGARLVEISILDGGATPQDMAAPDSAALIRGRADIVDSKGIVLAISLPTASAYANPTEVPDGPQAAAQLARALPDLDVAGTRKLLSSGKRFVWLARNLTPAQQYRVNRLGIPGVGFKPTERRAYPQGRAAAHALGLTDLDGKGIAGLERYFDRRLGAGGGPLRLSIDLRVQAVLHRVLSRAQADFRAIGAAGLVMDADSGALLAMVSLPDFDPNLADAAAAGPTFNRVTKGVYEIGSTFKLFTTATALDSGTVTLRDGYDASKPIRVARFTIADFHGQNRWLSVPEILVYSSNIGTARMALDIGGERQRAYLGRLGLLGRAAIELPEVSRPLTPKTWRPINTMTVAYGHGIAVSPVHVATGVAALVNGGFAVRASLLLDADGSRERPRVLSPATSAQMRQLMRLVVQKGTGRNADAPGYRVGGKTGTAEKQGAAGGGYQRNRLISSFVGAFPMDAPKYVVLALLDEPKGNESTRFYATAGWVAAPVVARVIERISPMLGIAPAPLQEDAETAGLLERVNAQAKAID